MKKDSGNYSKEELEIIDYIENHNPKSDPKAKEIKTQLYQSIKDKTSKRKALSIRLLEDDIKKIKIKAIKEGIPYQTLISSVIHKYLTGALSVK